MSFDSTAILPEVHVSTAPPLPLVLWSPTYAPPALAATAWVVFHP